MFPAITPGGGGGGGSTWDRLSRRARLEWVDPARRAANLVREDWGERKKTAACWPTAARPARISYDVSLLSSLSQSLLKAVGMFVTGVVVARNFGDAFSV
jgi:hypothetical protein